MNFYQVELEQREYSIGVICVLVSFLLHRKKRSNEEHRQFASCKSTSVDPAKT